MHSTTRLFHSIPADPLRGAVSVPILQISSFVEEGQGVMKGFGYSRTNNLTRAVVESILAQLENGSTGIAFGRTWKRLFQTCRLKSAERLQTLPMFKPMNERPFEQGI
jgi:hypothetical protein